MARRNSHPKYGQFRFDAGSLALNFVTTVRHRGSQPRDLLAMPESLPEWFRLAGLVLPEAAVTVEEHSDALLLREAVHDATRAIILNEEPKKKDVERINAAAVYPTAVPQFRFPTGSVAWETKHPVKACLSVIARDAITLMGGTERNRLKMCDNCNCRMIFVDTSPKNRRRWCAMSICGTRQKVALHRQRKTLSG